MPLEPGYLLRNRYRIAEILGQGGMGAVYKAVDENLGMDVAVKENLFTTDEYSRQFLREATILANMRHPNLPRVSDHFNVEEQGQYLVMDFIEGEDLRQRMDRIGVLPDEEVIVTGAAIADALAYLHSRKPSILHRDLKPGNIKITPQGDIYLVDFGLAKIVEGSQATTTGARAMTPGYSSPEQYGTARTDARSDVYSLGATLYAALTNAIPEDGLARAMEQADLTTVRKRNPTVSRRLAVVIEKALAIHPEDRYQTAGEFKQALLNASLATKRRVQEGEATVTPPPPEVIEAIATGETPPSRPITEPEIDISAEAPSRLRRRQVRRGLRVLAGALAALMLGFGGWYFFDPQSLSGFVASAFSGAPASPTATGDGNGSNTPSAVAALSTEGFETVVAAPTSTSTITSSPTLDPFLTVTPLGGGPGQLAFVSDRSGIPQIWLMNVDGTGLLQFTDIQGGACQPEWSPDGNQMVFISPCPGNQPIYLDSSLFIVNADGSGFRRLLIEAGVFDPAWSPDGGRLLFARAYDAARAQIFLYDLENRSIELMTDNERMNRNPAWSPDGNLFAFMSSFQIWTMEVESRATAVLFSRSGAKENTSPAWSPDGETIVFAQRQIDKPLSILVGARVNNRSFIEYYERRLASRFMVVPEEEPDFSPDGFWVAFESWPLGDNRDIYIMGITGADRTRLTTDAANDFDAAWRP